MRRALPGGLSTTFVLITLGILLSGPTCAGEDPIDEGPATGEAEPAADSPAPAVAEPPPTDPSADPCAVCVLGRELTPEEQEICARCNQPPAELAPAVPTDPCSVCIEGRALSPEEQELCSRCGGP